MNERYWNIITGALKSSEISVAWVSDLLNYSFNEVLLLPVYDGHGTEVIYQPSVELKKLEADYLEFLQQQIQLNARGDEWTGVLRQRLEALKAYVGREILTATFYSKSDVMTFKIDMETSELLYSGI